MTERGTNSDRLTDGAPPDFSLLVFTSHRTEEVVEPLRETDLDVEFVSVEGGTLPWRAITTVRRTRNAIAAHDPDVILLDCYETMGTLVTLLAGHTDIPIVDRLVGDTWLRYENGIQEAKANRDVRRALAYKATLELDEFILSRAVGFVVVSEQLGEVVRRRTACPPERIGKIPVPAPGLRAGAGPDPGTGERAEGGLDEGAEGGTDEGAERGTDEGVEEEIGSTQGMTTVPGIGTSTETNGGDRFGIDSDRVLLTVTNLKFREKLRGVERALAEVRPLLDADPDLAYVIAGGGEYVEELRAMLDERVSDPNVRRRIHTLGFVDGVADLYAMADVFVYVSYLDGYPRVVLEAQEAGLPVVANDAFGMREQIQDGENGFLIDPEETGELRDAVRFLLANPDVGRRYGEHGRDRVARENTPEEVGRQLAAFLRRLMAELD